MENKLPSLAVTISYVYKLQAASLAAIIPLP